MKAVEFQGMTFEVPDWARWIAQDGDGSIYAYEIEPVKGNRQYHSMERIDLVLMVSAPMVIKEIK